MATFSLLPQEQKKELWATLALRHAEGVGPRSIKRLIEIYGSALAAVEAGLRSAEAWVEHAVVQPRTARSFTGERWRNAAKHEWDALQNNAAEFLLYNDPLYPRLLREVIDPPPILYLCGDVSLLRAPSVGVVGARNCTREGLAVCAFIARDLARAGVTVISGMAKGIDRVAHLAALEGPGRSIGVLGTGIDLMYPPANADLFQLMRERGLILSEFAPGAPASASHFPIRNRLISGLCHGVLVVEAAERSGSLITARLALEQNREVFAVPGHTMAAISEGCRDLIRRGAKAVFTADDVLAELAPLLTQDTRLQLEERQRNTNSPLQALRPADALHVDMQNTAAPVLPPRSLPWETPSLSLSA